MFSKGRVAGYRLFNILSRVPGMKDVDEFNQPAQKLPDAANSKQDVKDQVDSGGYTGVLQMVSLPLNSSQGAVYVHTQLGVAARNGCVGCCKQWLYVRWIDDHRHASAQMTELL